MAFVTAWNKRTGKKQRVPEHYIDNPHIFDGAYTLTPSSRAKARKNADRPTPEATADPTPTETPADGETAKENPDA